MSAPAFDCHLCNRRLGTRRVHNIAGAEPAVVCSRCMNQRDAHDRLYPACTVPWHDAYDHPLKMATRAAANALLAAQGKEISE